MDIDRIAKEWPEMKRRLDALEQGGRPQRSDDGLDESINLMRQNGERLIEDGERLITELRNATAALELAREALDAARKDATDAATERAIGDVSVEVRPGANIHGIGPDTDGGPNPDYRPEGDDAV
jgi:ABC-type phosphonate transport system ATPase subunit